MDDTATKPPGVTSETWGALKAHAQEYVRQYIRTGNQITAYETSGYVEENHGIDRGRLGQRANRVFHGARVQRALLEYRHHQDDLDRLREDSRIDWLRKEHERLMEAAEGVGDLAVATRNLELIGRMEGAYTDVMRADVAARRELSETEREEARRLADLRLGVTGDTPDQESLAVLPGSVVSAVVDAVPDVVDPAAVAAVLGEEVDDGEKGRLLKEARQWGDKREKVAV